MLAQSAWAHPLPQECSNGNCRLTSKGWWPTECVHNVPNGTSIRTVEGGVEVIYPNGTVEKKDQCPTAKIPRESLARVYTAHDTKNANMTATPSAGGPIDPSSNNKYPATWWLHFGSSGETLNEWTASYTVPRLPTSGQGGSWWIGVENTNQGTLTVLQPVLYFHMDSLSWGIVSENCCPGGHDFRQGDVKVNEGDTIQGSIKRTSGTAYTVTTSAGGRSYTLNADNNAPMVSPLLSLEMYDNNFQCSDLPSGPLYASNNYVSPAASWHAGSASAASDCGWKLSSDGSTASASPPDSSMLDLVV